jgi:serine/threonine protein phosphatase PrpC
MRCLKAVTTHNALQAAFHNVNEEFLLKARLSGDPAGSTAVVALKLDCHIMVAHVGDSRALMCKRTVTEGRVSGASNILA